MGTLDTNGSLDMYVGTRVDNKSKGRELVQDALWKADVDPDLYGLHNLRSRGASVAAAAGIPDWPIQRQGSWWSESSMHLYLQEALPALLSVSQALAP